MTKRVTSWKFSPNDGDSSITHTVTRVVSRGDDGELSEATGASQTLTLAGDRIEGYGEGEVRVTRNDSWNSAGESAAAFETEGFTYLDLGSVSRGVDYSLERFTARVGGRTVSAGYPQGAGIPFDQHNGQRDWLGRDRDAPVDVGITVSRNAQGEVTSNQLTIDGRDDQGNGKTVTRSEGQGPARWSYENFTNDGQDFRRQTVFEGSDISTLEQSETLGEGQFRQSSQTTDGGEVIAGSEHTRREVSEEELRAGVHQGTLSAEQLERMLSDGPPYMMESGNEFAATLRGDDGELLRDDSGAPIQPGYRVSSSTFGNQDGYSVSDFTRRDFQDDGGTIESRLSTVTDPLADPPVSGVARNGSYSPSGVYTQTDTGQLAVDAFGRMTIDGEEIGQFDFGQPDLPTLLRQGSSLSARELLAAVKSPSVAAVNPGQLARIGQARFQLRGGEINSPALGKIADVLGVVHGASEIFGGIGQGDVRQILGGVGDMTGGFNSLAAATSVLAGQSRLGTAAGRLSSLTGYGTVLGKSLGAVGGVASFGIGVYDGITGETAHDRAGGWIGAAGGAVGVGSLFFGPPGWVVGGLVSGALGITSVLVSGADDNRTAPMDPRMF